MATLLQKANQLVKILDSSVDGFLGELPEEEKILHAEILSLIKDLKVVRGNISSSVANARIIRKLRPLIEKVLQENRYLRKVKDFMDAYNAVDQAQKEYFSLIASKFKPPALLREIKKQTVDEVADTLTERGLGNTITEEIRTILDLNIKEGGSYGEFTERLREKILGSDDVDGIMARHSRTFVTDSINQYSATYSKTVTDDLGLEWYQYVGSNITTTRPFCIALTAKRYVHKTEFSKIIHGNIDGKKVSLSGVNTSTTVDNFQILRGGWNCRHQLIPVAEISVPKEIRIETYERLGIEFDDAGLRLAA